MAKSKAHLHTYDFHPNDPNRVACTICGFGVPISALASRINLDALTAQKNATQAVRDAVDALLQPPAYDVRKQMREATLKVGR